MELFFVKTLNEGKIQLPKHKMKVSVSYVDNTVLHRFKKYI